MTNRMIKKKRLAVLAGVVALAAVIAAAGWILQRPGSLEKDTELSLNVEETVAFQKTCGDMQKELGKDSLYPILYTGTMRTQKNGGLSLKEAYEQTASKLLRYQALAWYAQNHGVEVTDANVTRRIETLITEMQTAEEYSQYQEAAKKLGASYEDIL